MDKFRLLLVDYIRIFYGKTSIGKFARLIPQSLTVRRWRTIWWTESGQRPEVDLQQCTRYAVSKEMKCSGDSEILHGLVHDATRICSCFSEFRVVAYGGFFTLNLAGRILYILCKFSNYCIV